KEDLFKKLKELENKTDEVDKRTENIENELKQSNLRNISIATAAFFFIYILFGIEGFIKKGLVKDTLFFYIIIFSIGILAFFYLLIKLKAWKIMIIFFVVIALIYVTVPYYKPADILQNSLKIKISQIDQTNPIIRRILNNMTIPLHILAW
ncbi:hypothetical protein DRO97_09455, partial [Archaeoglobales archaeon]